MKMVILPQSKRIEGMLLKFNDIFSVLSQNWLKHICCPAKIKNKLTALCAQREAFCVHALWRSRIAQSLVMTGSWDASAENPQSWIVGGDAQKRWAAFRQCAFSHILTSSVSFYRRSLSRPFSAATQAASQRLGWQLHQAGKTDRRVGGGGDFPRERNPHELWESEFGLGGDPRVWAPGRCSDSILPEGGDIVLVIRKELIKTLSRSWNSFKTASPALWWKGGKCFKIL